MRSLLETTTARHAACNLDLYAEPSHCIAHLFDGHVVNESFMKSK